MERTLLLLATTACLASAVTKFDDKIDRLPGITFDVNFNQYSGYLDASLGNHLHYWLLEAQYNPSQAPFVLWLNGGPGCSSLEGLFSEHGPFRPSQDGKHLVENVFAWNKVANILHLESPRNVGFSYRENGTYGDDQIYNDDKTASDAVLALISFFQRFPEYKFRDFYITGESYGGVYVPTLTNLVIKMINNGTLPYMRLKGMVVGNGEMSEIDQINSAIDLMYFRGLIGKDDFDSLYECCRDLGGSDTFVYCQFTNMITLDDFGNAVERHYDNPDYQVCSNKTRDFGYYQVWATLNQDVYNTYQDCYANGPQSSSIAQRILGNSKMARRFASLAAQYPNAEAPFVDQGGSANDDSTDSVGSFPCYMNDAMPAYLNLPEVRAALHIPDFVQPWAGCNDVINEQLYIQQHHDMGDVFDEIVNSGYPLRMLFYNGDADMACNFMGDQWFIERLATRHHMDIASPRSIWNYTRAGGYLARYGGFVKKFQLGDRLTIDLLTVKGAGHFVPLDRPAPALHMFVNYLNQQSYNNIIGVDLTPRSLFQEFQPRFDATPTRKESDEIVDLPGVTFQFNFRQYAGYLTGVPGNNLHYWFVESQTNPSNDPLVLWLTGGPGCSSLGAFLTENGPFHPNRDGKTLYENVFSWNKVANVLYLESPRGVGFSFQDKNVNPDEEYDDDRTAMDTYLALRDFLTVFPEYANRPFFITGESYGGIYIPSLASLLVDKITSGELKNLNFKGFAVGNGQLSGLLQVNSAIHLLYFHGFYGKEEWDALQECCPHKPDSPADYFERCDFSQQIYLDRQGIVQPRDPNSACGQRIASMGQGRVFDGGFDVYNMYQSCYEEGPSGVIVAANPKVGLKYPRGFVDQASLYSRESTDSQDGFTCWGNQAASDYLNQPDVQKALHVFENITHWDFCSPLIEDTYWWQHNDTTLYFENIIAKRYPLHILIYNGDVDAACNFLSDQWFIEALAENHQMALTEPRNNWQYLQNIAGYAKQYTYETGTIDLLTVKGGGHLVPADRPGPALQMISNYFANKDYSSPLAYQTDLSPLIDGYDTAEDAGKPAPAAARERRTKREHLRAKREVVGNRPPPPTIGTAADDQVTALPGLTFQFTPNQYSGYLDVGTGNYLHYWLVEHDSGMPDDKPLIIWLNGGPGCSSLNGLMTELGPFLNNLDGETLFENVYSWHKVANILFLESPRDVGFSYRANNVFADDDYSDAKTATDNVEAVRQFLLKFPQYAGREFYIMGESYGGVYVPTFTEAIIPQIQNNNINLRFVGVAIGNGIMSAIQQINSAVSLTYFRGESGKEDHDALKRCAADATGPMTYYDWTKYITIDSAGNAHPKNPDETTLEGYCGAQVVRQGFDGVWLSGNDVYNTFHDCYSSIPKPKNPGEQMIRRRRKRAITPDRSLKTQPFVDEAKRMNYYSTDANGGVHCGDGNTPYLNRRDVQDALHIPAEFTRQWSGCNDDINTVYTQQHNDTTDVFQNIIGFNYPIRFLIYNGDVDMACQFLGDQWFIENLAATSGFTAATRYPWEYSHDNFNNSLGGFVKTFTHAQNPLITIDLITINGAGHLVPIDRPGPILQVINNFVHSQPYNTSLTTGDFAINIAQKPLLPQYAPSVPSVTRQNADRVINLPGLTFAVPFAHHAGYLDASAGNSLFYWFIESQGNPSTDPLLLWLNGGPGCSSLGGLLLENGPFRPNPDGKTLFENAYTWNKVANILYIDSPRQVGFSYQNMTANPDTVWNDEKTFADLSLALTSFFTLYPNFASNDFYVTGESYGGVYVPGFTATLVNEITANTRQLNLKGLVIGNGEVSMVQAVRSDPAHLYFHGIFDKSTYDSLKTCCVNDVATSKGYLYCQYEQYINFTTLLPLDPADPCGQAVSTMAAFNSPINDYYNFYQDCYLQTTVVFGSAAEKKSSRSKRSVDIATELKNFDPISTDATGGFQCYMNDAGAAYMAQKHVRYALHVPDFVQDWNFCNDPINEQYVQQNQDTTPFFDTIYNSGLNLRALIYNGDVDSACSAKEAEWFIDGFGTTNNMDKSTRNIWRHRTAVAGYERRYASPNMQIDLVTIKGAGHFVPTDRPGPALQMITNFLRQQPYETPVPFSVKKRPLLAQYQPKQHLVNPSGPTDAPPGGDTTTTTQATTTAGTDGTGSTSTSGDTTSTQTTTVNPNNGDSSSSTTTATTPIPTTSKAVEYRMILATILVFLLSYFA